jgi:protein associated with RNAse G/E
VNDEVRVQFTKWGGAAHWTHLSTRLGADDHGVWCAVPPGTELSRPGVLVVAKRGALMLFPHDEPFAVMRYLERRHKDDDREVEIYVDIATVPEWTDGSVVTMVDLDLDVVQLADGTVYLDDEDEFAEHRVSLGYPPDVVAMAEASAADVLTRVRGGDEPFGAAIEPWARRYAEIFADQESR